MRKTLFTIALTFFVTVCLGLLALWLVVDYWEQSEAQRIKVAGGALLASDEGGLLHVRSGSNRIMLEYTKEGFTFGVFEDGEEFPLVSFSGGELEEDCFVIFSYRTAEGRWEAIQHKNWRGVPEGGVILPEFDKGLPVEILTFDVTRTSQVREDTPCDDPTHDHD